jgi:hypothetical protein
LVEKWNPPTRSETSKIGPKTEGILGVNLTAFGCSVSEKGPQSGLFHFLIY